jgi:ATP synthase F1 delta subunit
MKSSAKNLALATLQVAEEKDMKTAAAGLFNHLKKNNQLKLLPQIMVELEREEEISGRITAKVYSANPLKASEIEDLKKKIKKIAQVESVEISSVIDQSLIGGIKIVFGDKIIDQTIKNRINQLRVRLASKSAS